MGSNPIRGTYDWSIMEPMTLGDLRWIFEDHADDKKMRFFLYDPETGEEDQEIELYFTSTAEGEPVQVGFIPVIVYN